LSVWLYIEYMSHTIEIKNYTLALLVEKCLEKKVEDQEIFSIVYNDVCYIAFVDCEKQDDLFEELLEDFMRQI
jgi:hypothetical protein